MNTTRASEVCKRRLRLAARRLGAHDPVETLGPILDRSFDLPVGDPRYGENALLPGCFPLEHSFSELASSALRFDMEPLGPGASPVARRQEVGREVRRLVQQSYGQRALRWFDARSESWRGSSNSPNGRFGAWLGGAFDEGGLQEVKAYYELDPTRLDELPPNLQHAARVAMASLPGLVPIFTSIACGRTQGAQRLYFFHDGDLRLLDLEPLMNRLGVGHQLPSLLTAVGLILGGRFTLPAGSVVLGLRDTTRGMELRLDVLLPGVPDAPREMHGLIQMHLAQRPESQRALRQWMQAMTPDDQDSCGDISVVSTRVNPSMGARLAVYFRPVGYDHPPSRERRVADPYEHRV